MLSSSGHEKAIQQDGLLDVNPIHFQQILTGLVFHSLHLHLQWSWIGGSGQD